MTQWFADCREDNSEAAATLFTPLNEGELLELYARLADGWKATPYGSLVEGELAEVLLDAEDEAEGRGIAYADLDRAVRAYRDRTAGTARTR